VRFDALQTAVQQLGTTPVSGVLFDLGVSSPQLDRADRGFSYRHDAPLDMRMDRTSGPTAADVVNDTDERDLASLLRTFGDERFANRIAKAIVRARPVRTTAELAELVRDAIPAPARRTGGHPAKRTFQAIRIAVNEELDILPGALDQAVDVLAAGGRCAVLSYHSGEDRITKARFRHAATGGWTGPAHLPPPDSVRPTVRLLKAGAWTPDADEQATNPRAASARLRAVERLADDPATSEGPA
jgi:16S rRNA (cytosine1402-N4)-methyltransferase